MIFWGKILTVDRMLTTYFEFTPIKTGARPGWRAERKKMNKYMAYVNQTGEVLEHHDMKELVKACWSFLRLAVSEKHEYDIEFSRWNPKDQRWEYMGLGTARYRFCSIVGQFTRSFENYRDHCCIYLR